MTLDEILNRRLLIVSGKGGVGKTSVSAALGLIASRAGKKTLIAEVNAAERISQLFGVREFGYEETPLSENLYGINIDPKSAFEEYILEQIHSKKLYHLIFENRFVRAFLDATPGLNELLEIGKIWALTERDRDETGKNPKYDLVIVDAPATGHGLAFLNVPQVVSHAVRMGPLKTKAEEIVKLVQDVKKTLLILVTLAEEMPINEALEMLQSAKKNVRIATGPVILNGIYPPRMEEEEWKEARQKLKKYETETWYPPLEQALHGYLKKVMLQRFYLNKLKLGIGNHTLLTLPHLFRLNFDRNAVEELSENLKASFKTKEKNPSSGRREK
ncbi:MAG: ArsA family ATPase [bacterium]